MPTVKLVLEEGFLDDDVRVSVDGRVVEKLERVSTRVQVGVARMLDIELTVDASQITVELPKKGVSARIPIEALAPAYVGVSVSGAGTLEIRTGDAPPGYA